VEDGGALSRKGPTCSIPDTTVVVRNCAPLADSSGAGSRTGLSVDLGAVPGAGACGTDGGLASFGLRLRGSAEPAREVACGESATFDGLAGGTAYTVEVTARDASGATIGHTTCFRRAVTGIVLPAACDPLSPPP
jgi:hypothetical protein